MNPYLWILFGYIVGATPFGFLAGKFFRGIDIRKEGSGNIGATNVMRVLGKKIGYTVFALDVLKGFVPVMLAKIFANDVPVNGVQVESLVPCLTTVATILGHHFPSWLKFKGGKGIATSAGSMLPLIPIIIVTAFIIWMVTVSLTKYVSLASIFAAITLPTGVALQCAFDQNWQTRLPVLILTSVACIMAILRHRGNIERLLQGTERYMGETVEEHKERVRRLQEED